MRASKLNKGQIKNRYQYEIQYVGRLCGVNQEGFLEIQNDSILEEYGNVWHSILKQWK